MRRHVLICPAASFVAFFLLCMLPGQGQAETGHTRSAVLMGTIARVQIWEMGQDRAAEVSEEIIDLWRGLDARLSLFKPSGELVGLNARAGRGPTQVSDTLLDILTRAEVYRESTGGLFDITLGSGRLKILEGENLAMLEGKGAKLDLGGIAKGYALEMAVKILRQRHVPRALLDLGGQLFLWNPPPGGWPLGIREPGNPEGVVDTILVTQTCSIATSSQEDRAEAHILDPRTREAAEGAGSCIVVAPTATEADVLSTSFLIGNASDRDRLLKEFPQAKAMRVQRDGEGWVVRRYESGERDPYSTDVASPAAPAGSDA